MPKEAPKFVVSLVVVDGWPPICLSHVGIGTFLQGPYNPLLWHHVESLNQKPDGRAFLLTQLVDIPASFDQNRSNPDISSLAKNKSLACVSMALRTSLWTKGKAADPDFNVHHKVH